jgi:hypothetical protein
MTIFWPHCPLFRSEEGSGKFIPFKDDLPGSGFVGHPINALGSFFSETIQCW